MPPEPRTRPPVAVPLSPDDALPPEAPLPPAAQPVDEPPPVPALFEFRFMSVGMPPLSPESTLPPSTAPAVPVCALPPVVWVSSRRLVWLTRTGIRYGGKGESKGTYGCETDQGSLAPSSFFQKSRLYAR